MRRLTLVLCFLAMAASVAAQSKAQAVVDPDEQGFTSYASFGGSHNAAGDIFRLDFSAGYNFNSNFGMDVGAPILLVYPAGDSATGSNSISGFGDPYVDFRVKYLHPSVNFGSKFTVFVPVGDSDKGLGTGSLSVDWTNRLDRTFSKITPFVELGLANTIADSPRFNRPYTTLGFNAHAQGGASYELARGVSVGASGWGVFPSGEQKIFSKVVKQAPATTTNGRRVFETTQFTRGTAEIARDHGVSAWIGASPSPYVDMELGFTRSVPFDLNTISFNIGVSVNRLARRGARH